MKEIFEGMGPLLRRVAEELVLPRFRCLREGDVEEKTPGELVSVVDREVEAVLTPRLKDWLPGSLVVGDEAAATEPSLLSCLDKGHAARLDGSVYRGSDSRAGLLLAPGFEAWRTAREMFPDEADES